MESTKAKVIEAVKQVSKERADLLSKFGIRLDTQDVEESYGLWIVPAVYYAGGIPYHALDLNRALEDMQQQLEGMTGSSISILLNPDN